MLNILLFFQKFSVWFRTLIKELINNLISLFFILSLYFTLWYFPQAIDLLLILNQADAFLLEVPLYFGLLTAGAFLIWNAPKYFYYHNYSKISFSNLIGFVPNRHYKFQRANTSNDYQYRLTIHMRMVIPRILAIVLLAISALSILNAIELFGLENTYTKLLHPANTLLVVIFLLLFLSEPTLYHKLKTFFVRGKLLKIIFLVFSIALFVLMILLGTLNTQAEKDLEKLFFSNSALVVLFTTLSFNSYFFLKRFPKKIFYGGILVCGFSILILFFILNFIPEFASKINPLSILVFSFLSLFMISFVLILWGKKIKLPLFTIVLLLCFLMSNFTSSDHYHLHLEKTAIKRPTMDQYIYHWIASRKEMITASDTPFPVVLVSAEGGGSRAGLWSFLVHSYLYKKSEGRYFRENLLSLTGASGGSVGNAMFFSEAQHSNLNGITSDFEMESNSKYRYLKYKASAIYKENYLSESLLSLLGRDLFKEITGIFRFKNRGQLLEEQWENTHAQYFSRGDDKSLLTHDFLSFYEKFSKEKIIKNQNNVPPLLLINTTHTQTGAYNVISPVRYDHLKPLAGLDDFYTNLQKSHSNASISLATAMRINASFPYVTPVGEIENKKNSSIIDQYADAGYYDNIGGRISRGVEDVFKKIVKDSFPSLLKYIKIKHLVIVNEVENRRNRKETQLIAPIATLKNVRSGHTQEIMKKLGSDHMVVLKQTSITPEPVLSSSENENIYDEKQKIKPVLPVGRYLSTIAIRSMEARLHKIHKELDAILDLK